MRSFCHLAVFKFDGYAANRVTHGIRPEDLHGARRVSLVFRHTLAEAPGASPSRGPLPVSPLPWEPPLVAEVLIRLLQGWWCSRPESDFSQMYFVHKRSVTIFARANNLSPSSFWASSAAASTRRCTGVEASFGRKSIAVLDLCPLGYGVLCGTAVLEESAVLKQHTTSEPAEAWWRHTLRDDQWDMWLRYEN